MSASLEAPTMPVFVFGRRSDIERETGLILAGQLIVDIPKTKTPKRRQQRMIAEIVERLTADARSGQMPADAMVYGWPGGSKPANAVDVDNDALMASWAKDRLVIAVRVDPRDDGHLRVDSDMLLQMGLVKRH
jgi:hypothetical protein